jgi:hypothetical protein
MEKLGMAFGCEAEYFGMRMARYAMDAAGYAQKISGAGAEPKGP